MKTLVFVVFMVMVPMLAFAGERFDKMTSAEHLKYAKDAISKKALIPAKMHLDAIPRAAKEYDTAKSLYAQIGEKNADARRIQEENKSKADAQAKLLQRKSFAQQYEKQMLSKGIDAHASTSGKEYTTIKIKWVLIGRPLVYKLINEGDFVDNLKNMGFKKLILTDGYDSTWTYDLKKL